MEGRRGRAPKSQAKPGNQNHSIKITGQARGGEEGKGGGGGEGESIKITGQAR